MNKKILTILLILIAASAISIVSAADAQTIGGVEFNTPEGYSFDSNAGDAFLKALDDGSKIEDVGVFKNDNGDSLMIMAYKEDPGESDYPDDYEFENKTIHNKNGTFMSAPSKINVAYLYEEGDKFVLIQAADEDVLEETIK